MKLLKLSLVFQGIGIGLVLASLILIFAHESGETPSKGEMEVPETPETAVQKSLPAPELEENLVQTLIRDVPPPVLQISSEVDSNFKDSLEPKQLDTKEDGGKDGDSEPKAQAEERDKEEPIEPEGNEAEEDNDRKHYVKLEIEEGLTASQIAVHLENRNIISDADHFMEIVDLLALQKSFRAGTHRLPLDGHPYDVLQVLISP